MSEWISVEERLPEPLHLVIVRHKTGYKDNAITVIGKWVPAMTDESTPEDEDWVEYDEQTDTYYVPEGWYEFQANWDEYSAIHINEAVTHWMPLPEPPESE